MNFKCLILIPILFFCFNSFAQMELDYGFKIGAGTSKLKFNDINLHKDSTSYKIFSENKSDIGAHFGIFVRLKRNNKYLQSELLYTFTQGSIADERKRDNEQYPITGFVNHYFFRINMPIIFGLQKGPFALQAGPVLSYLKYKSDMDLVESDTKFSLAYQLGVEINIKNFFITARYENNITPVIDYAIHQGQKFDNYNLKNQQFVFSLGFILGRQKNIFVDKK